MRFRRLLMRCGAINPRRRIGLRAFQSCQIQGLPYPIHTYTPKRRRTLNQTTSSGRTNRWKVTTIKITATTVPPHE